MRMGWSGAVRTVVFVAGLSLSGAPVEAQYFGQNKVQYKSFDFEILKTDHFDIYYYAEEEAAVRLAAQMAERWYARLSEILGHDLRGRQPLILYASHPDFRQTNAAPGNIGEGTGGVTEAFKRRIVLPFAAGLAQTDHVLGHELVHGFQFDMTGSGGGGGGIDASALRLPLWFIEGMAEYLSVGPVDPQTAMWVRTALAAEKLPRVKDLGDPRLFPYRWGHAFWAFVGGRWGDAAVGDILREATGRNQSAIGAIEAVLGMPEDELSAAWHASIREAYGPVIAARRSPDAYGRVLVSEEQNGGRINVGPALSPDGSRLVFLSERDLFSIDLFLADARSGEVRRKIVSTSADPHFDSLQFISSAGGWQADGRRFVFAAIRAGRPVLTVLDVDRAEVVQEVELPTLGEIFNPTWSPGGDAIAFTALTGGLTDLFVYDLARGALVRLTDDQYAELHPSWSPDGRIAFVTDRFTSDLATLRFGEYRLAVIDPQTRSVTRLPSFDEGTHINPQWGDGGRSLYFVANPDGVSNVYRLDVAQGSLHRVTNLTTGVSGITELSPALAVAANAPHLVFSVHDGEGYPLRVMDAAAALAGEAIAAAGGGGQLVATLPPLSRSSQTVAPLLADAGRGLPERAAGEVVPYRPTLSLDYVGQPTLIAGADAFGTYVGGGISLFWSDMLGNHTLGAAAQVTGEFEELGGIVSYVNRKSRWNWGAAGYQIPYVTGQFARGFADVDGSTAFVEQSLRQRQIERGFDGLVAYPFNRAHRVEFSGGVSQIAFDQELRTLVFSPVTGELVDEREESLPSPDSLNFAQGSAALVYDTSIFGAASPVFGTRYRLEAGQTGGSLQYSHLLADFRRYFLPARPFTVAARGLHFGRYGGGAEDGRLFPLFLGYPHLVRGYDVTSFSASECGDAEAGCPAFDRLLGSRLLVANLELRFPLVGAFTGEYDYGPLPVELALFTDGGVAWTSDDQPSFAGGSREPVASVGVALRVNLLGFAIGELDFVRPLDRPQKGWFWQFNLIPGF